MTIFDWLRKLDPETRGLEEISRRFEQMLEDGRHVFDAAANGLIGGTDPEVIREDLFATDRRINKTEQEIRRQLVVHGSVHGKLHLPELLANMSLVKDAERIGDYGKNLFDLAVRKPDLGDAEARKQLVELKDRISKMLVKARNVYQKRDEGGAKAYLEECDAVQDICDDEIHRLLDVEGRNCAAAVLCYRYFKRVVGHASNIVTSLVMPIDKLDFFDEPKVR